MNILRKLVSFFKKPLRIIILLVVVTICAVLIFNKKINTPETVTVKRGTIVQEVRITGLFKPVSSVDLAFERSGRVVRVGADVGDMVNVGSVLIALDTSELSSQLRETQANVVAQQARLDELQKGTRTEELKISESQLQSAQTSLEEARKWYVDAVRDAYAKTDDSIRNKIDPIFLNPRTAPQVSFSIADSQVKIDLEFLRLLMESKFTSWNSSLAILTTQSEFTTVDTETQENLSLARSICDKMTLALNNVTPSGSLTQTTIDTWRANMSSARTSIGTAIGSLTTAREAWKTAQSSLEIAQNQYALKKAGATKEQIAVQTALLDQAKAQVDTIQTQISKLILRSPIRGVVTKQEAKVGELMSANTLVVSVISQGNLEMEANIPEVDVGKIAIGNKVEFTVDALPGETFFGKVSHIDPAETIIDGVSNFKLKAVMDKEDSRFKSGLTTNMSVETIKKTDVLVVPQYAILETDAGKFVEKIQDITKMDQTTQTPVVLGIQDQDGNVEILSGVSEGDTLVSIGFKNGTSK